MQHEPIFEHSVYIKQKKLLLYPPILNCVENSRFNTINKVNFPIVLLYNPD